MSFNSPELLELPDHSLTQFPGTPATAPNSTSSTKVPRKALAVSGVSASSSQGRVIQNPTLTPSAIPSKSRRGHGSAMASDLAWAMAEVDSLHDIDIGIAWRFKDTHYPLTCTPHSIGYSTGFITSSIAVRALRPIHHLQSLCETPPPAAASWLATSPPPLQKSRPCHRRIAPYTARSFPPRPFPVF